ncbi:hypothetical protein MMC10_001696 [Thelotrema lepadinum]|nr:hypothetical protein [Thelotrema lepadinum]
MSSEDDAHLLGEHQAAKHDSVYDVLIIGAGISGVNAAYRIQSELPDASYAVLEARGGMGGTWDFFRYPGIRSDSDLSTFGYPWRPWDSTRMIADGESIRKYVGESAAEYGIDKNIKYHHKVVAADWSSDEQAWSLTVEVGNQSEKPSRKYLRACFLILSTGYYDYDRPLQTDIPGLSNFAGKIVHPQFWPEGLDYQNKRIVIVGSGATAITLLPVLAEKASHVTMLQRSPGYIISRPACDATADWGLKWLPRWFVHQVMRFKYLTLPFLFYKFCTAYPKLARRGLKRRTMRELPEGLAHDPNFEPKYNPWEQRLCICPDGDFWKTLRAGDATVATGTINTVTADSIVYTPAPPNFPRSKEEKGGKMNGYANGHASENTRSIPADIIVTATGLRFLVAGGIHLTVNSSPVSIPNSYLWKGQMLSSVPNAVTVLGYTNASWTLGADATARHVVRLLKFMRKKGIGAVIPRISEEEKRSMAVKEVVNLNSTYVERARGDMPRGGDKGVWRPRRNYWADLWEEWFGNVVEGLELVPKK